MTGLASVGHIPASLRSAILRAIRVIQNSAASKACAKAMVTSGHGGRRSLYDRRYQWHGVRSNERASRTASSDRAGTARVRRAPIRTLQAAVRTGRLTAHFAVQSVFGRPKRLATRAAAEQFMAMHYRRYSGQEVCPAPLPTVPSDYDQQLRALRRRLRLTQDGMARRIGAAGKAVIYQWEARKRTPSPVFWQRIRILER